MFFCVEHVQHIGLVWKCVFYIQFHTLREAPSSRVVVNHSNIVVNHSIFLNQWNHFNYFKIDFHWLATSRAGLVNLDCQKWNLTVAKLFSGCRWIANCMRAPMQRITSKILHGISYFIYKCHVYVAGCSSKCLYFVFDKCVVCVFLCCVLTNCRCIKNCMLRAYTRYCNHNFARPKLFYILNCMCIALDAVQNT